MKKFDEDGSIYIPLTQRKTAVCFYTLGLVFIVLANNPAGYYRILLTSFTAGIWEHGNTGSQSSRAKRNRPLFGNALTVILQYEVTVQSQTVVYNSSGYNYSVHLSSHFKSRVFYT